MTEITDLSPTDSSNTSVTGESLDGSIANMGRMDNTLQAILGMFGRWTSSDTIASAGTTDIGAQAEAYLTVSGTTTITSFGTVRAGTIRFLQFSGILTLTYNATSLILPGAASITTAAGDTAVFVSEGSGNWRCLFYNKASGEAIATPATGVSYIVNGSMTVSQENGNTLGTTNGYFPADQWAMYFTAATAAMSIQRIQVRTLANAVNQLEYKCTTAKASLGASDNVLISQPIEGAWFQQAGFGTASAQRLIMRFQVQLPAGLYHWHFANSAGNRHCSVPFTIAGGEANTAVVKEIVVPPDTSGTWLTAEGVIGIVADLVLAAGATVTGGTASTWGGTTYYAASTQFNILSSTSNVARLADVGLKLDPDVTGVYGQYEVGEVDAVYRSDRYWQSKAISLQLYPDVAGRTITSTFYVPRMCKNFTLTTISAGSASNVSSYPQNVLSADAFEFGLQGIAGGSGMTVSNRVLALNARL